ncbi:hypothetical protein A259_37621, partial [Pseudomonas syringae pv. actinidiae ICMP 19070]
CFFRKNRRGDNYPDTGGNLRDNLVGAHQSCIRRWSDFVVVIRAFLVAFGLCVEARQKNFTKIMAVIE